jgi:low affinity Fe/Cu permease
MISARGVSTILGHRNERKDGPYADCWPRIALWTRGIRITTGSFNAGPHLIKTLTPFCIRGPERSDAMGYQEGLDPVQMTGALTHRIAAVHDGAAEHPLPRRLCENRAAALRIALERGDTLAELPTNRNPDVPRGSSAIRARWEKFMTKTFAEFANWVAVASGHPIVFGIATLTIVVWLVTGPFFSYSDTWQLVMNTWTDVATFLMVFLIQNSQNRDSSAIQAKLDELVRTSAARNSFVGIEKLTPADIERIRQSVATLAQQRSENRP